jgi:hypothetical protein
LRLARHFVAADAHPSIFTTPYVVLLLLGFAAAIETLYMGQINALVLALLLMSIWLSENQRSILGGLALAGAIALKFSPILFLFAFVALRRWREVIVTLGGLVLFTLLPLWQFQSNMLAHYGRLLAWLSHDIHVSPFNFSPLSLLYRLAQASYPLPAVWLQRFYQIGIGSVVVALVWLSWRQLPLTTQQRGRLFAIFTLLMVIASPLVWYHHMTFLLLPLALLLSQPRGWLPVSGLVLLLLLQAERLF